MEYIFILIAVVLLSPFILNLASNQKKETKRNLKLFYILLLAGQVFLGFLNWENFQKSGQSGYELAIDYPASFLGLFFGISLFQIILLILNKSFNGLVVVLNFINSALIFAGMIQLSNILGVQAAGFASIGAVFLVLIGNIIGLLYINKDKNLLNKYLHLR